MIRLNRNFQRLSLEEERHIRVDGTGLGFDGERFGDSQRPIKRIDGIDPKVGYFSL
jgi:hypothetical protein